jgi:subtilisin family serine protease
MIAGLIGAIDNDYGVVGVAPGTRIWSVRAASPDGFLKDSAVLCAFNWVIEHADVIDVANLSFGEVLDNNGEFNQLAPCGTRNQKSQHEAVCEMVRRGVTVVASAGNESTDASVSTPAAWPEVIAVSAIGDADGQPGGFGAGVECPPMILPEDQQADDHFAFFSNFGAVVDIAAPGMCLTSTFTGSRFAFSAGTSFAAPLVVGAAALYLATHPDATPAQVKAALLARAEPGPIPGDPDAYPEGVLNVRGL